MKSDSSVQLRLLRPMLTLLCAATALALLLLGLAAGRAGAVTLTQIGGFNQPTYVSGAPGKKNRNLLFVVQKSGQVIVLRNGAPQAAPFLDISGIVKDEGEEGLLSIAFHPNYERNRLFYVYFTDKAGDNEVWEFKRKRKSRLRALGSSARRVLTIPHPDNATNHNGGQLQFGPKKLLFIAPGDGGSTPESAQDPNLLTGKILRIDPTVQRPRRKGHGRNKKRRVRPYGIPSGNPFVGKPGRDEVYALGLRNPFRFSFDSANGALLVGDVGDASVEEIDYRPAGSIAGTNFGWPRFEGTTLHTSTIQAPGAVPPIFEYPHTAGRCGLIGGYVVHDPRLPGLAGRYLYGDLCTGEVRSLVPSPTGASGDAPLGVPNIAGLDSFGQLRGGTTFAVSLNGPVYRIDP
jgi:glucose/arabinose dehydrogenase